MSWDAIVIGSGFGGAMAAYALVHAGQRVLMLERGSWVARGPESWGPRGAGLVTPSYSTETPYDAKLGGRRMTFGSWQCVGGQSVYYGGASFRFRERDFLPKPDIDADSGAEWPITYEELEPYYTQVERLLGVAGADGVPNEPWRSAPYPQHPAPLSAPAAIIAAAAASIGLTPSRIPLAIAYTARGHRNSCVQCGRCDGYACAADAKNDLATTIIPGLVALGLQLRPNTVAVRLVRERSRIVEVHCVNRVTGARERLTADAIVLAAGTLATPHLILASGLDEVSPAREAVGRYLMRHRNVAIFGVELRQPNPGGVFDKQVAMLDFYDVAGCIQQMSPPLGLVRAYLARPFRFPAALLLAHSRCLVAITEDQPRRENGVTLDWRRVDRYGLPRLRVQHRYTGRDEQAAGLLTRQAKRVLHAAGASFTFAHKLETFTHALGTIRMGRDATTSPLDENGRFRGLDNLYVSDGSAMPRSAGVNPSLTIAANALRIGSRLTGNHAPSRRRALRIVTTNTVRSRSRLLTTC